MSSWVCVTTWCVQGLLFYLNSYKTFWTFQGVLRMYTPTKDLDHAAKDLTLKIFRSIDKDHDGKLSKEEFVDGAKTDKTLFSLLAGKPVIEQRVNSPGNGELKLDNSDWYLYLFVQNAAVYVQ